MTALTPNAELAYAVLDHIDAHPEQWNQGVWVGEAECGTVGCFAGWAVMLSGYTVNDAVVIESPEGAPNLDGLHIESASDALLGIDDGTAFQYGDIYDGLLTREELGRRAEEIFGPRPEPAPVDYDKPLVPVLGVPASGCDCSHDGGHGLSPHPDRERGHAEDCPAFGQPPAPALPFGTGCRCTFLGEGTPEHTPSPLCRSLRPDADRDEMQPPPCADHLASELGCPVCTAQRRAFYTALGRDVPPNAGSAE